MTAEEVNQRYQIPMKVLEKYHRWGLCGTARNLERLFTIEILVRFTIELWKDLIRRRTKA